VLCCLGLSEDPVSIWTTCLKEEVSAWTKVVGYGFPDSDLVVTCRVGVVGGLLLLLLLLSVLLLILQLLLLLWHRGDGIRFVEASLYLSIEEMIERKIREERERGLCFGSVRENVSVGSIDFFISLFYVLYSLQIVTRSTGE